MHKSTAKATCIIGLFLLDSLFFGGTNMMALQGAAAQNDYPCYDDEQYMNSY
jgi:hypothetical protein